MKLCVLDTDTLTLLQFKDPQVLKRVAACPPEQLAVTVISVEEQLSGWYTRLRRAKQRAELASVYQRLADNVKALGELKILSFTESAIVRYEGLKALKIGVRAKDLRIAAIALESDATLVTRNTQDFQRVPGLSVENWAQ